MTNNHVCLTIDYEFDWGGRTQSVYGIEKTIDKVLEIFEQNNAKSTFFISTETVEKTKHIIKKIHLAGHEVASHGHNHLFYYDKLSKDEIEHEISTSKKVLEDLVSDNVDGFRTPYFKKNQYTDELLDKYRYKYDSSSVNTTLYGRYENKQFVTNKIQHFSVSTLYGKLPAGLKWINIFGNGIKKDDELNIIYLHLFDLLSIKQLIEDENINKIPLKYRLFYLARLYPILTTFQNISFNSITIKSLIKDNTSNE